MSDEPSRLNRPFLAVLSAMSAGALTAVLLGFLADSNHTGATFGNWFRGYYSHDSDVIPLAVLGALIVGLAIYARRHISN